MPELEISRIHDAYAAGGECPICDVMAVAEGTYVQSFRGGRVMSPEVRVATNRSGFCPPHYERLYRGEGKLGLSLMVHTHLERLVSTLLPELERACRKPSGRRGLWRRAKDRTGAAGAVSSTLKGLVRSCFICDMLASDLERYCFTVLYLWQRDPEFPARLRGSRGFCLSHYAALLDKAERMLAPAELGRWLDETVPLMTGSLRRLEREVLAFSQSYHHSETPGQRGPEERTALSRALQKLSGKALRLDRGIGVAEDQDQDRLT